MKDSILQSKLTIPTTPPHTIERRGLLRRIEKSPAAGLLLFVAPAGYGKTTLAQQILIRAKSARKAWLHLDNYDHDSTRFGRYLIAALSGVLPSAETDAWGEGLAEITENICLALERYAGPTFWLVLDNWECVDDNPEICAVPMTLARSGIGRLRVIITSRVPPSFKARRGQTLGTVLRLDAKDLAFSLPEWHEAMNAREGEPVDEEDAARAWKASSGWCVSIGLMGSGRKAARLSLPSTIENETDRNEVLNDYIREELFDSLPTDLADFLCETSLFETLTAERCAAVASDKGRAAEFLSRLECSAIPHVALANEGEYRLHALVRQAFRSTLRRRLSGRAESLFRAAAERHLEEGMTLEAVELYMELADYEAALHLMDQRWSELFGRHGWSRVRRWLEALPAEYHDRPEYIKTYSNVLNVSGDNRGSVAFLKDRLSVERFSDDVESFGSMWANYWWGRMNTEPGPLYDIVLADHAALVGSTDGFSPTMLGIFQNTLGVAAYLELRMEEALAHVRRAAELVEEPYARLRVIATQNIALYSHIRGDSKAALELLESCSKECVRLGLQSQIPKMHMISANIRLALGHYRQAVGEVDHCLASMREYDSYSLQLDAFLGRFRGLALWYLGDRAEGMRLLTAAQEPAREFAESTGLEVTILREYLSLLDGKPLQLLSESDQSSLGPSSEAYLMNLALKSMRAFKSEAWVEMRRAAETIRKFAAERRLPQWVATGDFLQAMALRTARERKRMVEILHDGLTILRRIGWSAYPMAADEVTSVVISRAIRYDFEPELIELLLSSEHDIDLTPAFRAELDDRGIQPDERCRLWEAAARLSVRGLSDQLKRHSARADVPLRPALDTYREFMDHAVLPPLRVEMLGGFSVSSAGRPVRFGRASARLLLQHLLVAHPNRLHEEELIEHIWPESDPAKGRANLRTAAKDLRRALDPYGTPRGRSHVTYDEEHYGLELPPGSQIDLQRFVDLVDECLRKEAAPAVLPADRIKELRAALQAYRGPLLPMLPYESFAVELRERLHALFQRGSLMLAGLLTSLHAADEAAAVLERALAYDPLWTEGFRLFLHVLVERGRVLDAMRAYRNYEKRLKDELGLSPDEQIRELFEDIVKPPAQ